VEIKKRNFLFFPSNLFTIAVAMEKSTETAFEARSDERFIVRRASIESFFFVRDVLFELEREIRFSGFPLVL
jgi:hypothetical protein